MSKRMIITIGLITVQLIIGNHILLGKSNVIKEDYLRSMIKYPDLVIKAEIADVTVKRVIGSDHLPYPLNRELIFTEIVFEIEKVVAGDYHGRIIKAWLHEGIIGDTKQMVDNKPVIKPEVGDRVIVSLFHNPYGHNHYVIFWRSAFFRLESDCLTPYDVTRNLTVDDPLEVIENEARKRKLPVLYKYADLICTGHLITNNLEEEFLVLRVDKVLKGKEKNKVITISYKDDYDINNKEKGSNWLFFLKKRNSEYYTFANVNGFFLIKNGKLLREFRTTAWKSMKSFKEAISILEEDRE